MNRRGELARTVPLRTDPERVAEWRKRSRKPIPRAGRIVPVSVDRAQAVAEGTVKSAATRKPATARSESFPPAVAALIDARDPWCVHCGSPRDLHRHHRRIKGIGGDGRDHTDCACNGVRLCATCHLDWAHSAKGRREAGAEGVIIPRSETAPWRRSLMIHTEAGSGITVWPACDGQYLTDAPEAAA